MNIFEGNTYHDKENNAEYKLYYWKSIPIQNINVLYESLYIFNSY